MLRFLTSLSCLFLASTAAVIDGPDRGLVAADSPPLWIWSKNTQPKQTVYFRRTVHIREPITKASLYGTCDDEMTVYINGREAFSHETWQEPTYQNIKDFLISEQNPTGVGKHVIAVRAKNVGGQAALLLRLILESSEGKSLAVVTDGNWRVSEKAPDTWSRPDFNDQEWRRATVVGKLGDKPFPQRVPAKPNIIGRMRRWYNAAVGRRPTRADYNSTEANRMGGLAWGKNTT